MFQLVRRMGIALGSLVAAWLCVGLVGGVFMWIGGLQPDSISSLIATVVAVVLGGLIYRDIMRRERSRA